MNTWVQCLNTLFVVDIVYKLYTSVTNWFDTLLSPTVYIEVL